VEFIIFLQFKYVFFIIIHNLSITTSCGVEGRELR